jgi:putative acyl-CoA dehydrogenase
MENSSDSANQSPPFEGLNLFTSNPALMAAAQRFDPQVDAKELAAFGAERGSIASFELGRLANENPPKLQTYDARGNRLDSIEFHPAWRELMASSMRAGLHCSTWEGQTHTARAARLFMAYQTEAGHICPITMTHAAAAALRVAPEAAKHWMPKILARTYDPSFKPWREKTSVTIGMGMTERQGGTDVRANTTQAVAIGDHYEITGEKWFMSAPMCDAFLVLAQAPRGLTCFLMPRFTPDGNVNALHFQRLKDKLGNRSNASAEVEFEGAHAERIGAEGRGIATIIQMVQMTRLDCAIASAGLMRFGLAQAVHHTRHRSVFQRLLSEQPAMRAVLADLALESEAMTALVFRLARAIDRAASDPAEGAYARLLTPAIKYLVCKSAPAFLYESMECLGGNGYVEELPLARAYREAPVNAIWEGSGNVMALDVLRAAAHAPDATAALIDHLGEAAQAMSVARALKDDLASPRAESRARAICERLARLAATAALGEGGMAMAETYRDTRLTGAPHGQYGACDLGPLENVLLERALV